MEFDLLLPRKIAFGWGRRSELGALAAQMGRRAFLVDGSRTLRRSAVWEEMLQDLRQQGIQVEHVASAQQEPTVADVDEATLALLRHEPAEGDFVIGIGGGSALDLAKACSAMATNRQGESVRDFLEGVGKGGTVDVDPLPMLALPTTAGTGTEATRNAVISVSDPPCKKSLRSEKMLPQTLLIDPELTVSTPPAQTAYCGMDAITQLIESFLSRRANPVTDQLCLEGLQLALPHLATAWTDGTDREAREAMSAAALLSGMALANSGLGMAHGVAAALGAVCDVPHGLACAVMLPIAMRTNRGVAEEKLSVLGTMIGSDELLRDEGLAGAPASGRAALPQIKSLRLKGDAVELAVEGIARLCRQVAIPGRLREIGVTREQIPLLVAGSRGNSMNGNPRELSDQQLTAILEECW